MPITGTNGNDVLTGTTGDDSFLPLLGTDSVSGGDGIDTLFADYSAIRSDLDQAVFNASADGFYGSILSTAGGGTTDKIDLNGIERLFYKAGAGESRIQINQQLALVSDAYFNIDGGSGNDTLALLLRAPNTIFLVDPLGNVGSNLSNTFSNFERYGISLGLGANILTTGAGDDSASSWGGTDTIDLGAGVDHWTGEYGSMVTPLAIHAYGTNVDVSNGTTVRNVEQGTIHLGSGDDSVTIDGDGERWNVFDDDGGTDTVMITYGLATTVHAYSDFGRLEFVGGTDLSGVEHVTLDMSAANDTLDLSFDSLVQGNGYVVTANGGGGVDRLRFAMTDSAGTADGAVVDVVGGILSLYGSSFSGFESFEIVLGGGSDLVYSTAGNDYFNGGGGHDTISYASSASGVIVDLNTGKQLKGSLGNDALTSFEHVIGTAFNDKISLSASAGTAEGSAGNDRLFGGMSDDRLIGGAGKDVLTGGLGADSFVLDVLETAKNFDTIKDFVSATDRIEIAVAAFAGLAGYGLGALDSGNLAFGKVATTADQHLIYNSQTGALYYDVDGVGGVAQIKIAALTGHPALEAGDILLI